MLEKIRQRAQGLLSWGIVLLIGLSFALWGVTDYFSSGSKRATAAKVNGEKISWRDVDQMFDRMSRQFGPAAINQAALKEQVRMMLIQRTALLSSARSLGFRVGDQQIAEALVKIPSFQVEGKFSKDRYLEVLNKAAYSDMNFRQDLARDVLLSQLEQGLMQSSFVLANEATRLISLADERRNFRYLVFPVQKYQAGIKVPKEEIKSYYETHANQYVLPEQVAIEYVELSLSQLAKQQVVSEETLKSFYQEHLDSYSAPERVRARHILIPLTSDKEATPKSNMKSDAKLDEQAKNKAQALLHKIKEGTDFATLAKAHSVDTGSAKNGGDLGWFARGQMVPEFEKAVFSLTQANELASPVRTPYGYHIIQLIERKSAETRPFQEVRELVLEQVQREKAYTLFTDQSEKMAKLAFENTSSLEPIAKALGLKIQETPFFTQVVNPITDDKQSIHPLIKHPAVLGAAFSEAVLKEKNNSEPVQVGEFDVVVLRVKKHQPAVQQPLEQVSKKIEQTLMVEHAKEKAKELAESQQKKLRSGEITTAALATDVNLSWVTKTNIARSGKAKDIDKAILGAVFQMPHRLESHKPAVKTFSLANGDSILLILDKVIPGELDKADANTQQAYQRGMIEVGAQLEFALYANRVLNEAKIEVTEQPDL